MGRLLARCGQLAKYYACGAIGRYGDTIVTLRAVVIDPWLTMADFQRLLEAMDRRIVEAMNSVS